MSASQLRVTLLALILLTASFLALFGWRQGPGTDSEPSTLERLEQELHQQGLRLQALATLTAQQAAARLDPPSERQAAWSSHERVGQTVEPSPGQQYPGSGAAALALDSGVGSNDGNNNNNNFPIADGDLHLPDVFDQLPHLRAAGSDALRPAFRLGGRRRGPVTVCMGVPTVRRDKQAYLGDTLASLVGQLSSAERDDTVIIVFVAETDMGRVLDVAGEVQSRFGAELASGLLEVIAPPAAFYPDLDKLRITLEDPPARVRWRSKQNLDFAFLMMYAWPRATYYVQLEDDIIAQTNYMAVMKKHAREKSAQSDKWLILDFCQLGFIGKLFKSSDLMWLVQYLFLFYNDKPGDWLLEHAVYTKVCSLQWDHKKCMAAQNEVWVRIKPSLFQHMGLHSSLKGKLQHLKDPYFQKAPLFFPHRNNPPADVETNIKPFKQSSSLQAAYAGDSYFWGASVNAGDRVTFSFKVPTRVGRFLFRSGNVDHPTDKLYDASVEVQPVEIPDGTKFNVNPDGFIVVGNFTDGTCEGNVDPAIGLISSLRITVMSSRPNGVLLSEILIEAVR